MDFLELENVEDSAESLLASKVGNLTTFECLQMKISSLGIGGLPLRLLQGLKELKLSKGPPKMSTFSILTKISGL